VRGRPWTVIIRSVAASRALSNQDLCARRASLNIFPASDASPSATLGIELIPMSPVTAFLPALDRAAQLVGNAVDSGAEASLAGPPLSTTESRNHALIRGTNRSFWAHSVQDGRKFQK
jgi:hypothetical protein